MLSDRRAARSFAFWCRRTTAGSAAPNPLISANVSTTVQTPASAPIDGSCWTCPASLASSRWVSALPVLFRTPTFRTGSSRLETLYFDPVVAVVTLIKRVRGAVSRFGRLRRTSFCYLRLCLIVSRPVCCARFVSTRAFIVGKRRASKRRARLRFRGLRVLW